MRTDNRLMLIISGPSGIGKSTLTSEVVKSSPNFIKSISCTTRKPRPTEVPGQSYYFVNDDHFQRMLADQELLEYSEVLGNYYGVPRSTIDIALLNGKDVVLDLDWQGASKLKALNLCQTVTIYLLPPSLAELRSRLLNRHDTNLSVIESRMEKAKFECSTALNYDYVLINNDMDVTLQKIGHIISAAHNCTKHLDGLRDFIENL